MKDPVDIDALVQRPQMWFGDRPGYLRELSAMNAGFELASGFDRDTGRYRGTMIPEAFIRFVCERIPAEPAQSQAWNCRIEAATEGESEAWDLFTALWEEFRSRDQ